jgi:hypothetical protein
MLGPGKGAPATWAILSAGIGHLTAVLRKTAHLETHLGAKIGALRLELQNRHVPSLVTLVWDRSLGSSPWGKLGCRISVVRSIPHVSRPAVIGQLRLHPNYSFSFLLFISLHVISKKNRSSLETGEETSIIIGKSRPETRNTITKWCRPQSFKDLSVPANQWFAS